MSDLAGDLLKQYYGLGTETDGRKYLSIHESVENLKKIEKEEVSKETSITVPEETTADEESQEDIDDSRKRSMASESYFRLRGIPETLDDDNDANEIFDIQNIDFGPNIPYDVYENSPFSRPQDSVNNIIQDTNSIVVEDPETSDSEDANENKQSHSNLMDENITDNDSNTSSKVACESLKPSKCREHLPPLITKRRPVCNETYVDFADVGLNQFPSEILLDFPRLRMLYLSNNNLIVLPDEVFDVLKYLEWLDVRNNHLSSLPITIKRHPCLQTILLQGNKIENLPLELCTLPKLNTLQVTQNPLRTPPEKIVTSGFSDILEYLRTEWNNTHPDEKIAFKKYEIEPKLSTILCYRSPRKNNKKKIIPLRDNTYENKVACLKNRRKYYRPSNRCENKGPNIQRENRVLWYSKAKELFAKQALTIQRMKNARVLKEWRQDRRSYGKAMEKAFKRSEDDIPFGVDMEDYVSIFKAENSRTRKKNKCKYRQPTDINKKVNELLESLNKLEINITDKASPRTKQCLFKDEIEKLLQFQSEIQNLQQYNFATVMSKN